MVKAIVLLSGGIDSAVALYWAKREGYEPRALSINFYKRPEAEKIMTRRLVQYAGVPLDEIALPFLKDREDLANEPGIIPPAEDLHIAYIPMKNVIFYGIAGYFAELHHAASIITGLIRNDEGRFTDATREYFTDLEALMKKGVPSGSWSGPDLVFPLWDLDKENVITLGNEMGVPLEHTWSCFWDKPDLNPCGECPACIQRARAFARLGLEDPLLSNDI